MTKKIFKAAVIGLGRMGARHINACMNCEKIDLIAIHDSNKELEAKISHKINLNITKNLNSLIGLIDLAIIATPTECHSEIANKLLLNGIHCLIEKPITLKNKDAVKLINTAKKSNSILAVGHSERFNPAIKQLKESIIGLPKPKSIIVKRLNKLTNFNYTDDVILDLIIHDIDLINFLSIADVLKIKKIFHNIKNDITQECVFDISFLNDTNAKFLASRCNANRERSLTLKYNKFHMTADLIDFKLLKVSNKVSINIPVKVYDALEMQLLHFIKKINNRKNMIASGEEALTALSITNKIRKLF